MVIKRDISGLPYNIPKSGRLSNIEGFTLVELLVVTAIIGILISLAMNGFSAFRENARIARCIAEINGLEKDISAYAVEKGVYPAAATWLADIGRGALVDPWGHPYVYKPFTNLAEMRFSAGDINHDYDLYSKGADGLSTDLSLTDQYSKDDILRFVDGGYIGMASKF